MLAARCASLELSECTASFFDVCLESGVGIQKSLAELELQRFQRLVGCILVEACVQAVHEEAVDPDLHEMKRTLLDVGQRLCSFAALQPVNDRQESLKWINELEWTRRE